MWNQPESRSDHARRYNHRRPNTATATCRFEFGADRPHRLLNCVSAARAGGIAHTGSRTQCDAIIRPLLFHQPPTRVGGTHVHTDGRRYGAKRNGHTPVVRHSATNSSARARSCAISRSCTIRSPAANAEGPRAHFQPNRGAIDRNTARRHSAQVRTRAIELLERTRDRAGACWKGFHGVSFTTSIARAISDGVKRFTRQRDKILPTRRRNDRHITFGRHDECRAGRGGANHFGFGTARTDPDRHGRPKSPREPLDTGKHARRIHG